MSCRGPRPNPRSVARRAASAKRRRYGTWSPRCLPSPRAPASDAGAPRRGVRGRAGPSAPPDSLVKAPRFARVAESVGDAAATDACALPTRSRAEPRWATFFPVACAGSSASAMTATRSTPDDARAVALGRHQVRAGAQSSIAGAPRRPGAARAFVFFLGFFSRRSCPLRGLSKPWARSERGGATICLRARP